MSDHDGDAPFEDAVQAGAAGGGSSINSRLDSLNSGLSTIGTRIDALVTSTTTYRSALTDRLTEYSNLVSSITRNHATQLEEYRQANEQAVAELRHSLAASEEVLARVGQRIDELADERSAGGGAGPVLEEVRSILDAQEHLRRTIQDTLDRFGERLTSTQPAVSGQLERIERELDSSGKVAAESWGELAGLRAKVDAVLETSVNDSGAVSTVLDELRETLLDVASGEVVGALWDEFRAARESLDTLVARSGEVSDDGPDDQEVERLQADVRSLTSVIRELLDQAEVVGTEEDDDSDGLLADVATDIAALRSELSEGLVVEPSEALAATVDQLRAEFSGLDERMRAITELRDDVAGLRAAAESAPVDSERTLDAVQVAIAADITALRNDVAELRSVTETAAATGSGADTPTSGQITEMRTAIEANIESVRSGIDGIKDRLAGQTVDGEIRALRSGIDDIIGRLDEGLVLAEEIAPPAGASPELGDELATLRDQVTTEFDALRQLVSDLPGRAESEPPPEVEVDVDLSPITELLEHVRDDLAELPSRIQAAEPAAGNGGDETGPDYAALDPDTIDLLREEIRSAGGVSDEVVEAVRNDLVALRRRIKLRAEGELFTPEQLDHIAEAVARRLAE